MCVFGCALRKFPLCVRKAFGDSDPLTQFTFNDYRIHSENSRARRLGRGPACKYVPQKLNLLYKLLTRAIEIFCKPLREGKIGLRFVMSSGLSMRGITCGRKLSLYQFPFRRLSNQLVACDLHKRFPSHLLHCALAFLEAEVLHHDVCIQLLLVYILNALLVYILNAARVATSW